MGLKVGDRVQVKMRYTLTHRITDESYSVLNHIGRIKSISYSMDIERYVFKLDNLNEYQDMYFFKDELILLKKSKIKLPSWF